jgi:tetratricopeptide (TPR) repeat protein
MIGVGIGALLLASPPSLDAAKAALADFKAEEAIALLDRAKTEGPLDHRSHVELYEQLGTAYAYLARTEDALGAFERALALDPGLAISYELSPKVTFLFEQARTKARELGSPAIDVSWANDLEVSDPVEIQIEVLSDPYGFLKRATIHFRLAGDPQYRSESIDLGPKGTRAGATLPPAGVDRPAVIELWVVVHDGARNEVLLWSSARRPLEIPLAFEPPPPWYTRWWAFGILGAVAAGATAAALVAAHEPSAIVPGQFRIER